MNSDERIHPLSRATRRAVRGPAPLMAPLIESWRHAFERSAAEALNVAEDTVVELSLCRRPRDDHWLEDAAEISDALKIDNVRLVSLLRAAEAVEGLRSAHQAHDDRSGWLMAARDHDEED